MRVVPTNARRELYGIQVILGDGYVDYMWQERVRQSVAPIPSKAWPFRRAENVIQIANRKKR